MTDLYDVAREVTDDVMGDGTYADLNKHNPEPGVQRAIERSQMPDKEAPLIIDLTYHPDADEAPTVTVGVRPTVGEQSACKVDIEDPATLFNLGRQLVEASWWLSGRRMQDRRKGELESKDNAA